MAFKYVIIEDYFKKQIASGQIKIGEKISSEAELSKQFNLSRQTVRNAISNMVDAGLLYSVQGKGTFVRNKILSKNKTFLIGFGTQYYNNYSIFPKIISGISEQIEPHGYSIIISETQNTFEGEARCLQSFIDKNVDAIIMEPCKTALPNINASMYYEFARRGIPIVFFNGYRKDMDCSFVVANDEMGGYNAAKHLIERGHRDISMFFKYDDIQGHERFRGACRALNEYGISLVDKNVLWLSTEDYPYFWGLDNTDDDRFDKQFYGCFSRSTAMIVYNDFIAAKAIQLLKLKGQEVPNDYSIISFDDTRQVSTSSGFATSVEHPSLLMGQELGKAIMAILRNPESSTQKALDCKVIVGNTVKDII
jgi:GntR family transcriptional regulator of arabinose operon